MNKKPSTSRSFKRKAKTGRANRSWHNGGGAEIYFYSRSLQSAAKSLIEKLDLDRKARTDWDVCPIILLYRQALELQLKDLVGEGSNFLKTRTDPISLSRTHSLRWLAQIVCQIIKTMELASDFTCEGVASLAGFSALVNEVEDLDPATRVIYSNATGARSVTHFYKSFDVVLFAKKLDALLDLLDVTSDALAAAWDREAERIDVADGLLVLVAGNIKPTIH